MQSTKKDTHIYYVARPYIVYTYVLGKYILRVKQLRNTHLYDSTCMPENYVSITASITATTTRTETRSYYILRSL